MLMRYRKLLSDFKRYLYWYLPSAKLSQKNLTAFKSLANLVNILRLRVLMFRSEGKIITSWNGK